MGKAGLKWGGASGEVNDLGQAEGEKLSQIARPKRVSSSHTGDEGEETLAPRLKRTGLDCQRKSLAPSRIIRG